jgi:hypothetical protein
MDEPVSPDGLARFGPSRPMTALIGFAALLAIVEAFVSHDRAGRLLLAVAAVVLGAIAVTDLVFSPRLIASRSGLTIYAPTLRTRLSWPEVDALRVDERSRLGLASRALEIEAGDVLVVLGKRGLGRDPREVLDVISIYRPS